MAEAKLKLPDGTEITINGSPDEIAKVVSLYGDSGISSAKPTEKKRATSNHSANSHIAQASEVDGIDVTGIMNKIKDCDEAELIESKILDAPDVTNRVLMCLYINEKYFNSDPPMTTGDISKVLKQLGVPISTANVSNAISRKAKSFVMYDGVRSKGTVIRYSLNRRGVQYFEQVLDSNIDLASTKIKRATKTSKTSKKKTEKTSVKKSSNATPKKAGGYKPKYNKSLNLLGLAEFIDGLVLQNNTEYLVAFCQFLLGKRSDSQVNGDDIFTCFSELKSNVKMPGSFMNTLRNAQNRDHVITYDRGFVNVVLTPKGENLFHHDISKRTSE